MLAWSVFAPRKRSARERRLALTMPGGRGRHARRVGGAPLPLICPSKIRNSPNALKTNHIQISNLSVRRDPSFWLGSVRVSPSLCLCASVASPNRQIRILETILSYRKQRIGTPSNRQKSQFRPFGSRLHQPSSMFVCGSRFRGPEQGGRTRLDAAPAFRYRFCFAILFLLGGT